LLLNPCVDLFRELQIQIGQKDMQYTE